MAPVVTIQGNEAAVGRSELEQYQVIQHNKVRLAYLDRQELLEISQYTVDLALEVYGSSMSKSANNRGFVNGLERLGDDLRDASEQSERRIKLVGDVGIGVSMSVTVGALAWAFRGGALLSSVMAAFPLWSSIDLTHLISNSTKKDDEKEDENLPGHAAVERIFD